jgi:hypothetical protein
MSAESIVDPHMRGKESIRRNGGDEEIAELAGRQHGVVARRQLLEVGLGGGPSIGGSP